MNTPKEAIRLHQKPINDRNIEEYIKTVVFPFTYQNFNGTAITVKTAHEYGVVYPPPWETVLSAFPDWLTTVHESVEEIVSSELSAVFKITARWKTTTDTPHKPITAIWITVKLNGKWGLQFRHNLGTI